MDVVLGVLVSVSVYLFAFYALGCIGQFTDGQEKEETTAQG